MKPKQVAKWVIKTFLLVSGIVFFVFSVHGVIGKFIDYQTTMSISKQPPQPLKPPAITFCPAEGFDAIKMLDKFSMNASDRFNSLDPNNEKIKNVSLIKVFKDSSYVIGSQIFIYIDYPITNKFGNSLKTGTNLIKTSTNDSFEIRIYEMFTYWRGLCYTLMMDWHLSEDIEDLIVIRLEYGNFSTSPFPIDIELGNEVDRFDLVLAVNENSHPVRFQANPASYYMVQGLIKTWKSMTDCDFETQDTFAIYLGKRTIHQIEELNCTRKCLPVQMSNFKHLTNVITDICTNIEDNNCNTINTAKGKWVPPCHILQYIAQNSELKNIFKNNTFGIQFKYQNHRISVHKEVLLFDFWTMLGTVGGSLGLFIGFSYFDFGVALLDRFL
jgi:hypothetical protein